MKKSELINYWEQYSKDNSVQITRKQLEALLEIAEFNDMIPPARLLPIKGTPLVEGQTHFVQRDWESENET